MNDLLLDGPPKVDGLMKRIGPFWGEEDGLLTKNWSILTGKGSILNKDKDSILITIRIRILLNCLGP